MQDVPQTDDTIERGTDPLPPLAEDFGAVRVAVDPILSHRTDGGCGNALPKKCDLGGPRKTIEQIPGSRLGVVAVV